MIRFISAFLNPDRFTRLFPLFFALALLAILVPMDEARGDALRLQGDGSDKAFLPVKPWSGYWWSRKEGKLVKGWAGNESPLKKYDRFVQNRTGRNPGAHAWEANPRNFHFDPSGPGWAGHCNGWSAAAIMEPEPRVPVTVDGVEFTTADQKALLSEMWMDCRTLFYGKRKDSSTPFSLDIYPNVFHRLLVENIKQKKRGMVADTSFSRQVWNYPIYGYETQWKRRWWLPGMVHVTTTVYFADDGVKPEFLGTKTFTKTYHYVLQVNGRGEITGGVWDPRSLWDHPDFVWIPTADSPAQGGENPKLTPALVYAITRGGAVPGVSMSLAMAPAPAASEDVLREAGIDPDLYFR